MNWFALPAWAEIAIALLLWFAASFVLGCIVGRSIQAGRGDQ